MTSLSCWAPNQILCLPFITTIFCQSFAFSTATARCMFWQAQDREHKKVIKEKLKTTSKNIREAKIFLLKPSLLETRADFLQASFLPLALEKLIKSVNYNISYASFELAQPVPISTIKNLLNCYIIISLNPVFLSGLHLKELSHAFSFSELSEVCHPAAHWFSHWFSPWFSWFCSFFLWTSGKCHHFSHPFWATSHSCPVVPLGISLSCPSCIKACWNTRCAGHHALLYSFPKFLLPKQKSLYQHPLWLESLQHSPVGMSEGLPSGHRDWTETPGETEIYEATKWNRNIDLEYRFLAFSRNLH